MKAMLVALVGAGALAFAPISATSAQAAGAGPILYSFNTTTGLLPNAVVADKRGTVFAMTLFGGTGVCQNGLGCGTVFSLSPPAAGGRSWAFHTLYDFTGGRDGAGSLAPLTVASNGTLYGYSTSISYGTVFSLAPPAVAGKPWRFRVLHVFRGRQEGGLGGLLTPLVYRRGALYGIAYGEPSACGQAGCGSVFKLTPSAGGGDWTLKTIFAFAGGAGGGLPNWIVGYGDGGPLYVSTSLGNGAVVALTPPHSGGDWKERVITTFAGGADGQFPSNLVRAQDGALHGLASGSTADLVFQLTPPAAAASPWTHTTIASVSDRGYGATTLAQGPDGSLIGAIYGEVDLFPGGIFQLTPKASGGAWTYSLLWNFKDNPGRNPLNVITGAHDNLLGALDGGNSSDGFVFALPRD
jgi:hypothetical protein